MELFPFAFKRNRSQQSSAISNECLQINPLNSHGTGWKFGDTVSHSHAARSSDSPSMSIETRVFKLADTLYCAWYVGYVMSCHSFLNDKQLDWHNENSIMTELHWFLRVSSSQWQRRLQTCLPFNFLCACAIWSICRNVHNWMQS